MDDEWLDNPILIYGPRKSGSSLLQNLIDGGNQLLMIPGELNLNHTFKYLHFPEAAQKQEYLSRGRSLHRDNHFASKTDTNYEQLMDAVEFQIPPLKKPQLEGALNSKEYLRVLGKLPTSAFSNMRSIHQYDVKAFRDALHKNKVNYSGWASKEVGGACPQAILTYFKTMFPKSRIVFIARDPRFIVRSIILNRRRQGITLPLFQILKEYHEVQRIMDFYYGLEETPDLTFIFYEDLSSNTEAEMKHLAKRLGIEYSEVLTQPTVLGIETVVTTSSQHTKKVFKNKDSEGTWKKDLSFRETVAIYLYEYAYSIFRGALGKRRISYAILKDSIKKQRDSF